MMTYGKLVGFAPNRTAQILIMDLETGEVVWSGQLFNGHTEAGWPFQYLDADRGRPDVNGFDEVPSSFVEFRDSADEWVDERRV